jgi:transposase-like protein
MEHFHPDGLSCPNCKAGVEQARIFRTTSRSQLTVYRCRLCNQTYNLYSGTLLAQHHLTPEQVVLLLRGILKGESTKSLAGELELNYKTVMTLRHQLQERAKQLQSQEPLADIQTETDEMFQNAGEKRRQAS